LLEAVRGDGGRHRHPGSIANEARHQCGGGREAQDADAEEDEGDEDFEEGEGRATHGRTIGNASKPTSSASGVPWRTVA
jgi:hypothetical protein